MRFYLFGELVKAGGVNEIAFAETTPAPSLMVTNWLAAT
jgi:hypothetical protein